MKLTGEISGERHELEIRREAERVTANVDGRHYEADVRETGDGGYLVLIGGRVYECRVGRAPQYPERIEARVRDHSFSIALTDPKRLGAAAAGAAHADASAQIVAPMPGKIVRVLVEVGAQVEAGASLVVVEAMKMQNEMKAPRTGRVATLNAEAGATVNAGDVLAIIE